MDQPVVDLRDYGWDDDWAREFEQVSGAAPGVRPGRVVRHDGVAVLTATAAGVEQFPMRVDDALTVGDWVVVSVDAVTARLPRRSLMRRRDSDKGVEQLLAANIDVVVAVCGLDRPVKDGRIQRAALLARDAGAEPVVVLTKLDVVEDPTQVIADVEAGSPGVEVFAVSNPRHEGVDAVASRLAGLTAVLVGESGAGKSTLTNALSGSDVAATGAVRKGDSKGRHTTTSRELYPLPGGGVLIDSPGIRSMGVWGDPAAVAATFTDVASLGEHCRFSDCLHATEPGCAVRAAVAEGELAEARLEAWRHLAAEARAAEAKAEVDARRSARRGRR
ncbi:MAG: ribosome small subunit-dependent GTPase A [Acidimicrobiales bacterium]